MDTRNVVTGLVVTAALAGAVAMGAVVAPMIDPDVNPQSLWEANGWDGMADDK
jgi:uncharacterized membrane protein